VVSTRNFQKQASNFSVKAKKQPLAMEWCGSDAVVLLFNNEQIIVASSNEFIPYPYSNSSGDQYPYSNSSGDQQQRIILIPEIDSLRIVTNRTCECLSIVPFSTQDIFSYGSQEPASLLYDSYEDFEIGDARADSHRRQIATEHMEDAVIDCLDAAKYELEMLEYQMKLLRACKYGKLFISNQEMFDCDQFVETCRFLRVLNNVRQRDIGMPLTYIQFEVLTPQIVVQRLINRKKHLLAINISKYLNLPYCVNQALEHWAMCKIECSAPSMSDAKLVHLIRGKVEAFSTDFSYAKIARCAQKRSVDLAKLLLDYEPRSKIQIASLLEFEQYVSALKKSRVSLNIDLVNQTLIELISQYSDQKTWSKLFALIYEQNDNAQSGAQQNAQSEQTREDDIESPFQERIMNNLLMASFVELLQAEDASNEHYKALLARFLSQHNEQNLHLLATHNLISALQLLRHGNLALMADTGTQSDDDKNDNKELMQKLENATMNYEKLRNKFNVQMCADLKRLIVFQTEFDKKVLIELGDAGIATLGLSVNDTIAVMLEQGDEKSAEKIKKEMFVPEKRWWFILIDAYCQRRQFDKLAAYIDKHSSPRRPPPCGYLPIVEAFLDAEQPDYAKAYILKLHDLDEKLEWLCQLNFWMDAVDVAVDEKDFDALQTIKLNCNDSKVRDRIDHLLANLK